VVANRTGFEQSPEDDSGIDFWGTSFIAGPHGELLAEASTDQAENLLVEVDLNRTENIKRIWPYFRDRRIDAYDDISKRWRD
jgi:N-carbamoylputrescine amidase